MIVLSVITITLSCSLRPWDCLWEIVIHSSVRLKTGIRYCIPSLPRSHGNGEIVRDTISLQKRYRMNMLNKENQNALANALKDCKDPYISSFYGQYESNGHYYVPAVFT